MNRNVPGLVIAVEAVHMTPPRRNSMVSLPHVEHLARESGKVRISHKLGLKAVVGGLPKAAPGIIQIARDIKCLRLVIVDGDIQHSVCRTPCKCLLFGTFLSMEETARKPLTLHSQGSPCTNPTWATSM